MTSAAHRNARPSRRRMLGLAGAGAFAAALPGQARAQDMTGSTVTFGNRIPRSWFWVQGLGVSDQGYGKDPFETFALDLALRAAGIEDYNVMTYSSVVPKVSYGNISRPDIGDDGSISRPDHVEVTPGSVLEAVLSEQSMAVPAGEVWTVVTGLGLQWAAETGSPETLRNGYVATYIELNKYATRSGVAERAARVALHAALGHELKIRDLVPFAGEEDPTVVMLASQVDNSSGIGPLFATQITGLACYEYVFPVVGSK